MVNAVLSARQLAEALIAGQATFEDVKGTIAREQGDASERLAALIAVGARVSKHKHPELALEFFRSLDAIDQRQDIVRLCIAVALQRMGKHDEAWRALEEPPEKPENAIKFLSSRINLLIAQENHAEAVRMFQTSNNGFHDAGLYASIARSLVTLGRTDEIHTLFATCPPERHNELREIAGLPPAKVPAPPPSPAPMKKPAAAPMKKITPPKKKKLNVADLLAMPPEERDPNICAGQARKLCASGDIRTILQLMDGMKGEKASLMLTLSMQILIDAQQLDAAWELLHAIPKSAWSLTEFQIAMSIAPKVAGAKSDAEWELLESTLAADPKSTIVYWAMRWLEDQADWPRAWDVVQQSPLENWHIPWLKFGIETYVEEGNMEKAKSVANALKTRNFQGWEYKIGYLISTLNRQHRYADAVILGSTCDHASVSPKFISCLAWALDALGRTSEALELCERYPQNKKDAPLRQKERWLRAKIEQEGPSNEDDFENRIADRHP